MVLRAGGGFHPHSAQYRRARKMQFLITQLTVALVGEGLMRQLESMTTLNELGLEVRIDGAAVGLLPPSLERACGEYAVRFHCRRA